MSRRIRTVLIAVAAIVVIVVVGAVFFVVPNMNDDDAPSTTAAPPTTAAPTSGDSELDTGADGFGVPDADLSGRTVMVPNNPAGQPLPQREPTGPRVECTNDGRPVTSPESMMIQRNFGVSTLYSETDGPSYIDGLVLAGYTRTPQGAALAAANFLPRGLAGGDVAVEASEKLLLNGSEAIGPDARAVEENKPVNTATVALRAPMGFKILSCTDSFAVVELALIRDVDDAGKRMQNPTYTGLRMNMVWDQGTWKAREATGPAQFGPYNSLDGFTRWAL
ncbi:lipase chaperone [Rhodococcoides fascians]|uniref:lipase chaperone n=1 Tax=Rhodococcoides fascians TaxID=1828 RepID=UPI00050CF5D4|nr:lipase chaperone [Rhodococcus fascians]